MPLNKETEIELHSRYYVHFQLNTLRKGINPLILHTTCPLSRKLFKLAMQDIAGEAEMNS